MITLPTLSELKTALVNSIESQFNITLPSVGGNFLRGMSDVMAGKLWLLYKTVAFTQKNIFVDTADSEAIGGTLERFGRVKLGRNPFGAVSGQYKIAVTGSIGAVIPASTTFKSDDDSANPGYLFVLDSAYTFTGTTGSITLRALTAGLDSELENGNTLTATVPIALVDEQVTVSAIVVEPQSAEDLEDYRQKAIEAYRLEAQGGAGADYRLWSFDAQGVKTSYPYAKSGNNNEVNLYVEATIADSTDGQGTPSATILSDVEDAIELPTTTRPSRKPLGVYEVNYLPVNIRYVSVIIDSYANYDVATGNIIYAAIKDYLSEIRPFVSSIDILANQNDTISSNAIISVILQAVPGASFGTVTMEVDNVPSADFQFFNGDIPAIGIVSYT